MPRFLAPCQKLYRPVEVFDLTSPSAVSLAFLIDNVEPPFIKGDGNGDGVLEVSDSILILRLAQDLEDVAPVQRQAADFNGDGVIDALDASQILRIVISAEPLRAPVRRRTSPFPQDYCCLV